MTYSQLKWFTILLPTIIIGGFEYIRHDFLLDYISMEEGNLYITILTFVLSYIFATWMFNKIKEMNQKIVGEQSRRAVYEEQERLARELHDNIAQGLFFLKVKLKQGDLGEARMAVNEIDNNLRQAIFNLRTLPDESITFTHRLGKWLGEWCDVTGIEISKKVGIPQGYFTTGEEVQLFGIIQEAFTNIRKHARANHAEIHLKTGPEGWFLVIADDGKGMNYTAPQKNHFGLSMIQERANKLGATLVLESPPQGGTKLTITVKKDGK
ncbi:sensor histidine kinase [Ammoniphilus sp. CFH 90114]|uniref:sensor histidine kinase n=1 Tax=Ammoniphilus sp. CFH 90114 TaxID=2493665 RepID=UPI00100FA237|nr:ATP-binding protein [Ammoniphilus sp. CFH 90114]RXT14030.1 sensor histidine kinase [Ammoniphilus sp. CFH 90114]